MVIFHLLNYLLLGWAVYFAYSRHSRRRAVSKLRALQKNRWKFHWEDYSKLLVLSIWLPDSEVSRFRERLSSIEIFGRGYAIPLYDLVRSYETTQRYLNRRKQYRRFWLYGTLIGSVIIASGVHYFIAGGFP